MLSQISITDWHLTSWYLSIIWSPHIALSIGASTLKLNCMVKLIYITEIFHYLNNGFLFLWIHLVWEDYYFARGRVISWSNDNFIQNYVEKFWPYQPKARFECHCFWLPAQSSCWHVFFYYQCSNNEVGCMSTEMQWTTRNPTYCGVFWLSGQSLTAAVVDRFWLSLLSIAHFLLSCWWSANAEATTCLPPIQGWHQIPSSEYRHAESVKISTSALFY